VPKLVLQVLLDEESYEAIREIADGEDTSMSAVARRLILESLRRR
jgi:hypothetical protein